MQIPILSGVYTDADADFRSAYPINLVPVPKQQGISNGYLRPADGIIEVATGPGVGRGSITWDGVFYAVMGTKLVTVDSNGVIVEIGDVGGAGPVTMNYSFTHLGIASSNNLYLYDKTTLAQVTDSDLGNCLDFVWIDGYFMSIDGEFLVVTELTNPFAVDPNKYGSSEINPDPVTGILKLANEVYALNRYTIEVFDNVGGSNFPFQRIKGAQIGRGCVGTHAKAVFLESIAFVGGSENESSSVWLGRDGQTKKLATREIEEILLRYSEGQLAAIVLEVRTHKMHEHLLIHLPDMTLVYDYNASAIVEEPVWFILSSSIDGSGEYRARYGVWTYGSWHVFDTTSSKVGRLTSSASHHWGDVTGWQFNTDIIYNNGAGAIIYDLELVCLTGRIEVGKDPQIATEFSLDGTEWSQIRRIKAGGTGERLKRLVWFDQGSMRNWRTQRFSGTSDAFISPVRLEARIEGLVH